MVYEPLGYSGALNIGGIILQLIGFILLLTQFQNWIEHVGRRIGDTEREITATNRLVIKWGIIFVILGTASQLVSALLNAYAPNFLSDLK
ncbi:MAG: hypothetical protein KGI28_01610 [Thaumarchaeota archaeon]|nr:hypothetical protein [Nitrososphaerota archaeon]